MNMMNPNEIKTHETFAELFPIKQEILDRIVSEMKEKGFDLSQPIILGQWPRLKDPVCIDGHTRLKSAIDAGIESVPVWIREDFEDEDEAFLYAIKLQRNRRNMTDAELISCVNKLDNRRQRGGDRRTQGTKSKPQHCGIETSRSASAKELSEMLGISTRKVEQTRTVLDHAEPKIVEAVNNSEMSINKAYQETQKVRREAKQQDSAEASKPEKAETVEPNEEADEIIEDENDEPIETPEDYVTEYETVRISSEHYEALIEYGDSVEELVAEAIERYLEDVEEDYEQFEIAQEHVA